MSWERRVLSAGIECLWRDTAADRPLPEHWAVLERTAPLIPAAHRSLVRQVELRGHAQEPSSGGGHDPTAGVVRLSHACLRETYNREINVTLLHEVGHLVDHHYGVVGFLRGQGANGAALLRTGHRGDTGGPGERVADCYMIYLAEVIGGRPYRHPADPAAYRGAAARMRFDLLLRSPAFAGMAGYREWQSGG